MPTLGSDPVGTVRMGSGYPCQGIPGMKHSRPWTCHGHKKFIQRITWSVPGRHPRGSQEIASPAAGRGYRIM
jgi:hypothetical protein